MFEWKAKATNAILLDDVAGKGREFKCRFLEAGLVKYSFGVCLLEKETINKFAQSFVGCPVIINHKDLTEETAKDERVGVISEVWFDAQDGWFWCKGIIFDNEAINLIEQGYNVSCQYEITEYSENKTKALHNGNPYDKVILNGKGEHLAIVKTPRYENAMIAVNAIEVEAVNEEKKEFVTVGEGESAHAIPVDYMKKGKKETSKEATTDIDAEYQKRLAMLEGIDLDFEKSTRSTKKDEDRHKKVGELELKAYKEFKTAYDNIKGSDIGKFAEKFNKKYSEAFKKLSSDRFISFEDFAKRENKQEKPSSKQLKLFNDIKQAINEIKESGMFNLFKKKEIQMDKDELKALFMDCLNDFTAVNAKEEDEVKEEDAKEEKANSEKDYVEVEAENKCKNEDAPDYKKLYEELKAKVEAKNEEEKEEKEEVDKEVAKNEIDTSAFYQGEVKQSRSFLTEAEAIKLGEELY